MFVFSLAAIGASNGLSASASPTTATGIPLDAPWKKSIYALARSKFIHPAWGWQHSERNYDIAMELAHGDRLRVDTDVLFAAAFLHDIAAFEPCRQKMEHGACAAVESAPLLRRAGFPMRKYAAVAAAERTHMYYMKPGPDPAAVVLHDADSLDFLGSIGAARMISLTGASAASFKPAVKQLSAFVGTIPRSLVTRTARRLGRRRADELRAILNQLSAQTFESKAM